MIKRQHENVECVYEKNQERDKISLCSVWCSSPSTISHAETLLKVCSKFQVFISYSFRVIIFFFSEIMIEGAVDPLNGQHFNAVGHLNSRQ
jgi:hypothetical protein